MTELHKKEQIKSYEERWQRMFYIPSGDSEGNFIHVCELCHGQCPKRIPGGHFLCNACRKKLRLWNEKRLVNTVRERIEDEKKQKFPLKLGHPADPAKTERIGAWKKIIKMDYLIEILNKNFP